MKQREDYQIPDKTGSSGLFLKDPSNLKQEVEFDPESNDYKFSEKVGGMDYGVPKYMSLKDYEKYDFQKSVERYWRQRAANENFEHKSPLSKTNY